MKLLPKSGVGKYSVLPCLTDLERYVASLWMLLLMNVQ